MIAGRAIQALGAGAMVPVAMAYVADVLPPERRPLALGIVGAVDTAGWVIGPLYGALMVAFFNGAGSSTSISLSVLQRAPVCGSACAGQHRTPSVPKPLKAGGRLIGFGASTLTAALLALTLALSGSQQESGGSWLLGRRAFHSTVPLAVCALLALLVFVWQERRVARPLIPLGLFADRTLAAACAANLLVGAALIIAMVDVPLFVNVAVAQTLADAPLLSGSALALFTLGMVGGSLAGGWLTGRRGYRLPALWAFNQRWLRAAFMSWPSGAAVSRCQAWRRDWSCVELALGWSSPPLPRRSSMQRAPLNAALPLPWS